MSLRSSDGAFHYDSRRPGATFMGSYLPVSEVYAAVPGSLEHWLTERYCLYARKPDGSIWRNEVHHTQWPLRRAEAEIAENTMFDFHGLRVGGPPALLHYSERVDVVVWSGKQVPGK
jgi:uncharacterized protein YqjF (DUF2071 family)